MTEIPYDEYVRLKRIQQQTNTAFENACTNGDLKKVRHLLTSPKLKVQAEIHYNNDFGFRAACDKGHLDVIKYLLTSPELKEHANIHAESNEGFNGACAYGHLEVVKYLLTSPDLKNKVQLDKSSANLALGLATVQGRLEIVKYLIESPELKEYVNIHASKDRNFRNASVQNHLDIVQYFIFDLNFRQSKPIKEHLIAYPNEEVTKMFELRELNKQLGQELNSTPRAATKKIKI